MKIASLIIGIVFMVLSGLGIIICLLAPAMTNGRASFEESMLVAIPLAGLFFVSFVVTIVAAVFVLKAKKNAARMPNQ